MTEAQHRCKEDNTESMSDVFEKKKLYNFTMIERDTELYRIRIWFGGREKQQLRKFV